MDPLTQGALGAALPKSARGNSDIVIAGVFGFVGGLAADLDVLIRSSSDPLMFLEYHRQFSHSLIFIPIGGFICALLMHAVWGRRQKLPFYRSWLFCVLGYATHTFLDASTSYGTMLFWPFSDVRFSWSIVSIVDPLLTLPLVFLVLLSAFRRRALYARAGLAWVLCYLGVGALQHQAALSVASDLAAARGHVPDRLEVKPSFANIVLWKSVYEAGGRFYVDAMRVGLSPKLFEGASVAKLDVARDVPWLDPRSQQAADIERFRWFSDGYIAKDPIASDRVIDVRYSFIPNEVAALWSIELSPDRDAAEHASFATHRENAREDMGRLFDMILSP